MDNVASPLTRHRINVQDYHRMGEANIFGDNKRIELIAGDLIDMAPIGGGHAAIVNGLTEAFVLACAGRANVSIQNPVRLDQWNEPQPDLAILRRRADFYAGQHPGPADVLLLVEVADTSLPYDQTVKLPLYARAGIPELWIVDLKRRTLNAHRNPVQDTYQDITIHHSGAQLALSIAPEIIVKLDLIFA